MRDICNRREENNDPAASFALTTMQASITAIKVGADDGLFGGIKTRRVRCGNGEIKH